MTIEAIDNSSMSASSSSAGAAKPKHARDVAPHAFVDDGDDDGHTLDFELRHLAAFDNDPVDLIAFDKDRKGYLAASARRSAQLLVNKLFDLPIERTDAGPVADLPDATMVLPRAKPVPKPKPETRWQKFARERGIMNKKKNRMVFDEERQEWAPNWGFKRANKEYKEWAVDIPENQVGSDDLFDGKAKQNRLKNRGNQLKNQEMAARDGYVPPVGLAPELVAHTSASVDKAFSKGQRGKARGGAALSFAQNATASLGKFDTMRPGEGKRKGVVVRRQFEPSVGGYEREKGRAMEVFERVLSGQKRKATGEAMPQQQHPDLCATVDVN